MVPFQTQKTDDDSSPRVKVTRIHPFPCRTRIPQPGLGVAETRPAESRPRSKATRPPRTSRLSTLPDALPARGAPSPGPASRRAPAEPSETEGLDTPGERAAEDGLGRRVEAVSGSGPGREADGAGVPDVSGGIRGRSYAASDTTVRTPNQDRVTADPVASTHAPA